MTTVFELNWLSVLSERRLIFRSAAVVSFYTALSRIAGLIRDVLVSHLLGTTHAGDAFNIAFRIPNLLRRLTAEGAASAAFIPVFTAEERRGGRESAFLFAANLICLAVAIMSVMTVLGIVATPALVRVYAWGFRETAGKTELAVLLTRIMFPYMLLISLTALGMGILNSLRIFAPPSASPILLNLSIIGSALYIAPRMREPAIALAVGVVVGGLLQLLLQVPAVLRAGLRLRWSFDYRHPAVRRMGRLMVPGLVGIGATQVNVLVGSAFASMAGKGAVTAYYLSDRLIEFLLGVYAIAISTAILPSLAQKFADGNREEYGSLFCLALRLVVFLAIPATLGLAVLRYPIVSTLFEHGVFDANSTALTAAPLLYASVGLCAIASLKVIVPAFYARQDTRTPVIAAVIAMLANLLANILLSKPMGVAGPAISAMLAAWINCLILYMVIRRKLALQHEQLMAVSLFRSLASAAPVGVVLLWAAKAVSWGSLVPSVKLLVLGGVVILSAGVYFAAAWAMRCPEMREFAALFQGSAVRPERS